MIPEDLRLTAEALVQVKRLCQWAERQVAELEQVTEEVEAQPQPQPQPSPPLVPTVAAAAFVSPPLVAAAAPVPVVRVFDPTVLERAAALKAGPRVGSSPATVLNV